MEPEMNKDFGPDAILSLMRRTKKADPLFKVLKKLKTALEVRSVLLQTIGYENLSPQPTANIIMFHFGLGGQVDLDLIKQTRPPQHIFNTPVIIPGKSFCLLHLESAQESGQYLNSEPFAALTETVPSLRYCRVGAQKGERLMIGFCCTDSYTCERRVEQIEDTNEEYAKDSIAGLIIVEDIITREEEAELLKRIDGGEWQRLNNRKVQHYGYEFKYGRNQVDKDEKLHSHLPSCFSPLLHRLEQLPFIPHSFDQLTINDYLPGDGIPAHFDTHSPFNQVFIAISMLSGIVMDFRRFDGREQTVFLKPRSLMVFSGEGRYAWTHGITGRKIDKVNNQMRARERRVSLTFRKIREGPCRCSFSFYCDSQGYDQNTMKKNNPLLKKYLFETQLRKKLEQHPQEDQLYRKYVVEAYQGIGGSFHNKVIEPVCAALRREIEARRRRDQFVSVLDVGCGNGEYRPQMHPEEGLGLLNYVGIELCTSMEQFPGKVLMDARYLGFRRACFDLILCVAVLHHLPSHPMRIHMLQQIWQVLRDGGIIIVSVLSWKAKQQIYGEEKEILLEYCVPFHKAPRETGIKASRVEKKGRVYERYYHLFQFCEVEGLLQKVGFSVRQTLVEGDNIIVSAVKEEPMASREDLLPNDHSKTLR